MAIGLSAAGLLLVAAASVAQPVHVPPSSTEKAAPTTLAAPPTPAAAPATAPNPAAKLPAATATTAPTESPRKAVDEPVQPILEADPKNPNVPRPPDETKPKPVLIREGRRLFDRSGTIVRVANESVFISDTGDSPMVLAACKALERVENLSDFGKKPLKFLVSGEVSEYRDRNYLLMTEAPRNDDAATKPVEPPAATRTDPSAKPLEPASPPPVAPPPSATAPDGRDRSVPPPKANVVIPPPPPEPTVPVSRPRTTPVSRPAGEPGQIAGLPMLLPEDKRLIDREGRLVREGTASVFIFDNGDTPVVLIPNLKLQRMEELSDFGRQPVRFRVSGRITEYRGRNHLTMTKVVVIPKAVEDL
jgi:hypothetical protein